MKRREGRNQNGFSKAFVLRVAASLIRHIGNLNVGRAYYRANSLLLVCIGGAIECPPTKFDKTLLYF